MDEYSRANRQTLAVTPTWNSDAEMLKLIEEEEAREQMKAKTTDSMKKPQKGQNAIIDDKPIFVGSRVSQWEKTIHDRNEDVKRTKQLFSGTGTVAPGQVKTTEPKVVQTPSKAPVKPTIPVTKAEVISPVKPEVISPVKPVEPKVQPVEPPKPEHPWVKAKPAQPVQTPLPPPPKVQQKVVIPVQPKEQPIPQKKEQPVEAVHPPPQPKKVLNMWQQVVEKQKAQQQQQSQKRKEQFRETVATAVHQLHHPTEVPQQESLKQKEVVPAPWLAKGETAVVKPSQLRTELPQVVTPPVVVPKQVETPVALVAQVPIKPEVPVAAKPELPKPVQQEVVQTPPPKPENTTPTTHPQPEPVAQGQSSPMKLSDRLKMFQNAAKKAVIVETIKHDQHPEPVKESPAKSIQPTPVVEVKAQKQEPVVVPVVQKVVEMPTVKEPEVVAPLPVQPKNIAVPVKVDPIVTPNKEAASDDSVVRIEAPPKPVPTVNPDTAKIKESIDDNKIVASNVKNMWEKVLNKHNTDVAQSRQSWNQLASKAKEHIAVHPSPVKTEVIKEEHKQEKADEVDDIIKGFMEEDKKKETQPALPVVQPVEQKVEVVEAAHEAPFVQQEIKPQETKIGQVQPQQVPQVEQIEKPEVPQQQAEIEHHEHHEHKEHNEHYAHHAHHAHHEHAHHAYHDHSHHEHQDEHQPQPEHSEPIVFHQPIQVAVIEVAPADQPVPAHPVEPNQEVRVMEIEAEIEYETDDHHIVHKHKHYEVTVDQQHHSHLVETFEEVREEVPEVQAHTTEPETVVEPVVINEPKATQEVEQVQQLHESPVVGVEHHIDVQPHQQTTVVTEPEVEVAQVPVPVDVANETHLVAHEPELKEVEHHAEAEPKYNREEATQEVEIRESSYTGDSTALVEPAVETVQATQVTETNNIIETTEAVETVQHESPTVEHTQQTRPVETVIVAEPVQEAQVTHKPQPTNNEQTQPEQPEQIEQSVSVVKKFSQMLQESLGNRLPGVPRPEIPRVTPAEEPATEPTPCHPEEPSLALLQPTNKKKKPLPAFSEL